MVLTLLSALARQNVDPWQEAAELSSLPRDTAIQRMTSRLEDLPGDPSSADRTALVERLMPLLPDPRSIPESPGNLLERLHVGIRRIGSSELSLVLIYVILIAAAGWMFAATGQTAVSAQTSQQALVR